MSEKEVLVGQEVDITWTEVDGTPAGARGVLVGYQRDLNGTWAELDWGYEVNVASLNFKIEPTETKADGD